MRLQQRHPSLRLQATNLLPTHRTHRADRAQPTRVRAPLRQRLEFRLRDRQRARLPGDGERHGQLVALGRTPCPKWRAGDGGGAVVVSGGVDAKG